MLIAGPTASGKSEAAMAIAERLDGIVINADSMQVYRDLRILTARPSEADEARVEHHLFGHVDAAERYSVGRWLGDVASVLDRHPGRSAVLVGGTGLYFKALTEGIADIPDIPAETADDWKNRLQSEGSAALHAVLAERDPEYARTLNPADSQRIVRALAVLDATGGSLADHQSRPSVSLIAPGATTYSAALLPDRQTLYDHIDRRFAKMIDAGALDEVGRLVARALPRDLPAMKAIGVPELAACLSGEIELEDAIAKAQTQSRRYAKRQMTWIRGQMPDWRRFAAPDELIEDCLDLFSKPA